jgi:hypothetical protein
LIRENLYDVLSDKHATIAVLGMDTRFLLSGTFSSVIIIGQVSCGGWCKDAAVTHGPFWSLVTPHFRTECYYVTIDLGG